MPDDPTFATVDVLLGGMNTEILVVAAGLFGARVEHDEVVDDFEESLFIAKAE